MLAGAADVVSKGRLGPGQTVVANLEDGTFKTNTEVAREVADSAPYAEWMAGSKHLRDISAGTHEKECTMEAADALRRQAAAGFGLEDTQMVVEGMAQVRSCSMLRVSAPCPEFERLPSLYIACGEYVLRQLCNSTYQDAVAHNTTHCNAPQRNRTHRNTMQCHTTQRSATHCTALHCDA